MYVPRPFAEPRPEVLHAFLRQYPLAALVSVSADGLTASHVPLLLDANAGVLRGHLARANPHWRALAESPSVLALFTGPEHYVTPSWYPSKAEHGKVVPTWNYTAVHVSGRARVFEDKAELLAFLERLTAEQESAFAQPWRVEDAPSEYVANLADAIVGVEIAIERVEGKWKLSQNRPEVDRAGVLHGLEELDSERSRSVADLMKKRL